MSESEDDDDDVGRELVHLSDDDPVEALDWISRLTDHGLPTNPLILFCKFNAARHLATDRLYSDGRTSVHAMEVQEIRSFFGVKEIEWARVSLTEIARLEEVDPHYLREHDFIYGLIDQVSAPLERVQPGAVQDLLGWIKLGNFGSDRIRFVGNLIERIPKDVIRQVLRTRIAVPDKVTAAIVYELDDSREEREVRIMLLRRDLRDDEVVGDVLEGTLRIHEDGSYEYARDEPDQATDQEGLEHPNREHLLREAEMLLKYENRPDRCAYLRQLIEWLNGRGERPSPVS